MDSEEVPIDDNAHTGCYIFKAAAHNEDLIDDRPKKKRKTTKPQLQGDTLQDEYTWLALLGGEETQTAIQLRKQQFETQWQKHQTAIEEIMNEVDNAFVEDILQYVRQERNSIKGSIKTGLLLSIPGHNAQHDLVQGWKSRRNISELLVVLSLTHAPNLQTALKNVIRMAICDKGGLQDYTNFLAEHKATIPMNFDLELLQKYTQKHGIQRIAVIISEVETFDTGILSQLTSMLASWADRIPFVLLIGIATTIELFESRLSRSTVSLLDAAVFEPHQSQRQVDPLSAIYEAVQYSKETRVFLGPAVVSVLAELAEDQSTTVETFTRAIKYVLMSHFFANPLSVLESASASDFDISAHPALCQAIRNTNAFRKYCEALAKGDKAQRQKARDLLTSDESLGAESLEAIKSGQQRLRCSLAAVRTLKRLSRNLVKSEHYTSLDREAELLAALPDLTQTETFETIEQAILQMDFPQFQTFINEAASTSALEDLRLFTAAPNPSSTPKEEQGTGIPSFRDIETAINNTAHHSTMSEEELTNLIEGFLKLLKRYLTSQTQTQLPFQTASPPPPQPDMNSFHNITNPFHDFMSEAITYTLKSPLSSILHPRARSSLERALTKPADYLGCECCTSTSMTNDTSDRATLPPTSLLLNMLNEAGHVINVHDLWYAYRETIMASLVGPSARSKENGLSTSQKSVTRAINTRAVEASDESGNEEAEAEAETGAEAEEPHATSEAVERQALALFYRALADLRHLGFVKPSKRKPGVDCIAKTVWMGL